MSWPVYQQSSAANAVQGYSTQSTAVSGSPIASTARGLPAASGPSMDAYQHMTAEQQFAIQQQNWQQWQIYQQQYAQWQAQYGEQYQREMQNKMMNQSVMMSNVLQGPPPPPPEQNVPPPPPEQNDLNIINQKPREPNLQQFLQQSQPNYQSNYQQQSMPQQQITQQITQSTQSAQYQQPPPPPPPPSHNNMQPTSPITLMPDAQHPNKNARSSSQSNVQTNQGVNPRIIPNRFFDRNAQRDDNSDSFSFQSGRNNNNRNNWNNNNNNRSRNSNSNNNNTNNSNNSRNNFGSNNDGGNRNSLMDRGKEFNLQGRNNNNNNHSNSNFRGGSYQQQLPFSGNSDHDMGRTERNRDNVEDPLDDDSNKTPEEIAFDEQFRKWEEQFMNWKRDNANHPDRKAYNDYESKMEECRSKLLARRAEMRQRRAAAMKPKIIDHIDSTSSQIVTKDDYNESGMTQTNESQCMANADNTEESKDQTASVFATVISEAAIPGLDLVDESTGKEKASTIAQPDVTSNLSAINNILGDPNIKSLLSNIQKQQHDDITPITNNATNTSDHMQQQPPSLFSKSFAGSNFNTHSQNSTIFNLNRGNPFNRPNQDVNQQQPQPQPQQQQQQQQQQQHQFQPVDECFKQRNRINISQNTKQDNINQQGRGCAPFRSLMDLDIQNPFGSAQPQCDNFNQQQQQQQQPFQSESENDFNGDASIGRGRPRKRNRRRSLRRDNQNQQQNSWHQNNINNRAFGSNDDFNKDNDYEMDDKRSRLMSSENDSQSYSDEFYRPTTIIDYQNQSQPPLSPMKTDDHIPTKSNDEITMEYFPRKIIEYNHKSKIHVLQTLCPVSVVDYKHKIEEFADEPPAEAKSRLFPWHRSTLPQRQLPMMQPITKPKSILSRVPSLLQDLRGNTQQLAFPPVHEPPNERRTWPRNNRNQYPSSFTMPESAQEKPSATFPCARDSSNNEPVTLITLAPPPEPKSQRRREHLVSIDDILLLPGRANRPKKIVILMRGPPGSGKSYIAKLIKDKETEMGGSARIISVDDYFTTETDVEQILLNGKKALTKKLSYEYDASKEENYMQYVIKSLKKTITDGLFNMIIVDCNNCQLRHYTDMYNFSRTYTYTPYTCEMPLDFRQCLMNNIHQRTASDIQKAFGEWADAPTHYIQLDYRPLLDAINSAVTHDKVSMDLDAISDEEQDSNEVSDSQTNEPCSDIDADEVAAPAPNESKWDRDTTEDKLARLDGTNKSIRHTTIEDYLQMEGWEPPPSSSNGKKRVRWADIEEKRERDKQRAIGFVVGQTNWNHLVDDAQSNRKETSALTKIKYI